MEDAACWEVLWTLRTTATSRQTFPPRKTITVEHEYVPRTGGGWSAGYFGTEDFRRYCIDRSWLHSFDEMVENKGLDKDSDDIQSAALGYVLTTGANWKGPIGDFRLVVDKGKPDSLVSFCAEGIKQISPTQYEVHYTNFTPGEDLHILIVDTE